MNTSTATAITLTEQQAKRLQQVAAAMNRSPDSLLNSLVQEHIEDLLEELEDGIEAAEISRRIQTGEEQTISWEEAKKTLWKDKDTNGTL